MSPEAVALKYARVEPPPKIKNLSNNPLLVNGAANVSKNLLCSFMKMQSTRSIKQCKIATIKEDLVDDNGLFLSS